ncbi:hypothetical protein GCM10009661_64680 [Catellatospora chokoriensis]|uniref:Uncharacterized protein n=1 Tax=Catellatospora chokoriensis TaxID=310353 RepID=A0A8J3NWS6_9ACTN|nr:hypothetical protein Cch02nite_70640 [Catellatospora chokoriensis]
MKPLTAEWGAVAAGSALARLRFAALRHWPAAQRPDRGMCARIAGVVAASAPGAPVDRLVLPVRYALWSVLLDDRLDAREASPADLATLAQQVSAASQARSDELSGEFVGELASTAAALHHLRQTVVARRFSAAVDEAVAAGIEHAALGRAVAEGAEPAPDLDDYLRVAAATVNYRSFAFVAMAAVLDDALSGEALDRLEAPLRYAAGAVRLANDLRSVGRDRAEVSLNALMLRSPAGKPVTRRLIQARIRAYVAAHDTLLAGLSAPDRGRTGLVFAAGTLKRLLRLSIGMYRVTDLR